MRFLWPAQRSDRLTRESIALAVAITAVSGAAICIPVVTIYRATRATDLLLTERPEEIVLFVQPAKTRPAGRLMVVVATRERAVVPNRDAVERPLIRDTGLLTPAIAPRDSGAATAQPTDGTVAPPRGRVGPFAVPDRLSWVKTLRGAARDSLNRGLWTAGFDFSTPLPLTATQRDSAGRENYRLAAVAHDEHRPLAIPFGGGGGSLRFPFLSSGKSAEERRRDSVVHADNLARLARLAERARLKRDSILAASALAGEPKDVRPDSTRRRRPEPEPNDSSRGQGLEH